MTEDLRYGLRTLARNPGVSLAMILTLTLAIGANTAVFSVVYTVLLRPLPYPKPHEIVSIAEVNAQGYKVHFSDPNFDDIRASTHSLTGMAEYGWGVSRVWGSSGAERVGIAFVSRDFFRVMGVEPAFGRGFAPEDQHFGASPVALVSYGYWRQHLAGSHELSSVKLRTEDRVFSAVGVMPPGFSFPGDTSIWVPRELIEHLPSRTAHNWNVVGRLREGVRLGDARSDLSSLAHRLKQQYGSGVDMTDASLVPLRDSLTGQVRTALLILLGIVGFVLLVGCANIANLMLARAAARERELAIRRALGAGRGRVVRQFLAESLLVSLAGGGLGVLAAFWGVTLLVAIAPPNLPRLGDVTISLPVLLFAVALCLLVALALGSLTAIRTASHNPQAALVEGSRAHAGSLGSQRLGRSLVAGQLAITLVLLTGAGLLGRSLLRLLSLDPGYSTEKIVTMEIGLPGPDTPAGNDSRMAFLGKLFARLRAIPGIEEVGGASGLPLANDISNGTFWLLDRLPGRIELFDPAKPENFLRFFEHLVQNARTGQADYCVASEGYFKALGIALVKGRLFDDRDTANAPHAAVVSESLARATWPNQDPLGRTIEFGNMDGDLRLLTVVGVVRDVRNRSLEAPPAPTVYVNYRQRLHGGRDFTVVVRSGLAPSAVQAPARDIVRGLDQDAIPQFRTFQEVFAAATQGRRFNLFLVGFFAVTALLLAGVGTYGIMAYWVTRRTREIGVRMALGASPGDVLRQVLGNGAGTIAIGLSFGLAGAFALTRLLSSLLFGVKPLDLATFSTVSMLLAAVGLAATYLPARRAAKADPLEALRHE